MLKTILAGGETALPADSPSGRLDTAGEFAFVGALAISNGSASYKGSAVALSRDWVLTAGHNADLNDDGLPNAMGTGAIAFNAMGTDAIALTTRLRPLSSENHGIRGPYFRCPTLHGSGFQPSIQSA
ncbi:MAG: hypothetical protein NTW21_18450 [Verrucomicrobia bacterium]|nr:hypothetical protein [Verrucomicrobiota bacterium]